MIYPIEPNFERFILFLCRFSDILALLYVCLVWVIQIPKTNGFLSFLSVGARAQVSFCLPNFDVIRTKEAEMEPVYIACFGRGEKVFLQLFWSFFESF